MNHFVLCSGNFTVWNCQNTATSSDIFAVFELIVLRNLWLDLLLQTFNLKFCDLMDDFVFERLFLFLVLATWQSQVAKWLQISPFSNRISQSLQTTLLPPMLYSQCSYLWGQLVEENRPTVWESWQTKKDSIVFNTGSSRFSNFCLFITTNLISYSKVPLWVSHLFGKFEWKSLIFFK